ncbi:metallophosphoesterase family protein, partial [Georgenia sp. 10Sc9-8]|nr:metallophosphoesterase family protein [Georgenia halotolerans]
MRVTPQKRRIATLASATVAAALLPLVAIPPAYAADATPERIVLTPAERPDISQSFTWRTAATVNDGEVHIRQVGTTEWRTHTARANEELTFADTPTRTHSTTVTGLQPATEYEYFVGTEGDFSDTYRFTTAAAAGDPFTFIYFGDAQNQVAARWAPVVDQAYAAYPDAVGTVNAGDLINSADNDSEWTDWFGAMDGYSQTTNVIAAPGNHEYSGDEFLLNWKSNFEYDGNGPTAVPARDDSGAELRRAALEAHMAEAMGETVYFTDYQGVRFIALNATINRRLATPDSLPPCAVGCPDPASVWLDMQARWMDEILAENPHQWSVVTFHQPVFSTAVGRNEVAIRDAWLPVFQRNDVDLVLMGHDHTYARGFVNADATDTPGVTTGPVYAVSVSGPKYYEQQPADNNVWTQNGATQVVRAGHTSTFQGIRVDGNQIHYESIVAAKWDGEDESTTDIPIGGTLDEFTITKYDDGTKFVTEAGVAVPEQPEGPEQPGEPGDPGEATDEEPAEEPAVVPAGHSVIDEIESGALTGPSVSAVDPRTQRLYVAAEGANGTGTVNAVDLATGEVVDSFELAEPVKDMSYVPGLDAVAVGWGDGTLNAFSVASGSFGVAVEEDDIVVPYPLAGVAFDNWAEYIHYATQGAIVSFDLGGDVVAQATTPADPGRLRIDSAG